MAIKIRCPNGCGLKIPDKYLGRKASCPQCKIEFLIDETGQAVATAISKPPPGSTENTTADFPQISVQDSSYQPRAEHIMGRLDRSRRDRILLSRFLAFFLVLIGSINAVPAIIQWTGTDSWNSTLPNWTYCQVLIAAIQLVYAIFLWQIRDWSALKTISIVMLGFAAFYGFVSTTLLIGSVDSAIVKMLGISFVLSRTATIWSVTMLMLMIVISLLAMKEGLNWQRTEKIFREIST